MFRADAHVQQNPLPKLSLQIWISMPNTQCADAQRVAREVQAELSSQTIKAVLDYRIRLVHDEVDTGPQCGASKQSIQEEAADFEVKVAGEGAQFTFEFDAGTSILSTPKAEVRSSPSQRSSLPKDIATFIQSVFANEQISHLLHINSLIRNNPYSDTFTQFSGDSVRDIERQLARAAKTATSYHLTFSLFSAGGAPSSWDVQQALNQHILPIVQAAKKTFNIQVGTQVQLFSPYSPSIQSYGLENTRGHFLKHDDLTSFVNTAEWPLSPSIGQGPTLNFIVYVPTKSDLPLGIDGKLGGAWIVPQWGGITIINPEMIEDPGTGSYILPSHLSTNDLNDAFRTFSAQLLALLGITSGSVNGQSFPLGFRIQSHRRVTAYELHLRASSNLGSLSSLAKHLNTIPIPRHVAQLVDNSMSNLTASSTALARGSWDDAICLASQAFEDSDKAFFDKSMVGQAYFPDEHRFAVYMPFLGPVAVPLLVSLLGELKRFRNVYRQKKT
jgi:GPI-anchor transamidase subunit S